MNKDIWPLAILGHTHDLGTKVSGWVIDEYQTSWRLLGSADPQQPQHFRPLEHKGQSKLNAKDILAVRCGYENTTPNVVSTGGSRKEEMCALYLLYYSKDSTIDKPYCIGGQVLV